MRYIWGLWPVVPAMAAILLLATPESAGPIARPVVAALIAVGLAAAVTQSYIRSRIEPLVKVAERLDCERLSRQVLSPMLGIEDLRTDSRIDFVGGIRGTAELERRVDTGGWAAAFALYPTSIGDLKAVADAGAVMPPKSTWFEPKLADGMVSLPLD